MRRWCWEFRVNCWWSCWLWHFLSSFKYRIAWYVLLMQCCRWTIGLVGWSFGVFVMNLYVRRVWVSVYCNLYVCELNVYAKFVCSRNRGLKIENNKQKMTVEKRICFCIGIFTRTILIAYIINAHEVLFPHCACTAFAFACFRTSILFVQLKCVYALHTIVQFEYSKWSCGILVQCTQSNSTKNWMHFTHTHAHTPLNWPKFCLTFESSFLSFFSLRFVLLSRRVSLS